MNEWMCNCKSGKTITKRKKKKMKREERGATLRDEKSAGKGNFLGLFLRDSSTSLSISILNFTSTHKTRACEFVTTDAAVFSSQH